MCTCAHIHTHTHTHTQTHIDLVISLSVANMTSTRTDRMLRGYIVSQSLVVFRHAVTLWRSPSPWWSWIEEEIQKSATVICFSNTSSSDVTWTFMSCYCFSPSFPVGFYISIWCLHELLVLFCSLRHQCTSHVLDSAELFLYQFLDMEYWVHYIALWLREGKKK